MNHAPSRSFHETSAEHQLSPHSDSLCADELRRAVALALRDAREHARLILVSHQYGQPIAVTDEDVLDCDEFDQLLDPLAPPDDRFRLFRRYLHGAVAYERIVGLELAHLSDEVWLKQLFNETLAWGEATQQLRTGACFTEFFVVGASAGLRGPDRERITEDLYPSAWIPLRRAEFLALATGLRWDRSCPTATLRLRSGTTIMLGRDPVIQPCRADEPGLLVVIRRGTTTPWTLARLVDQGVTDHASAALLAAFQHAGCSWMVSGATGSGKTAILEALLSITTPSRYTFLMGHPADVPRFREIGPLFSHVPDGEGSEAFLNFLEQIRDFMTLSADTLVVDPATNSTAAAALYAAETGIPTLVGIDAASPSIAYERLARLAALASHGGFGANPQAALSTIACRLQLHIHIVYSARLRRRYISEVLLITPSPTPGAPQRIPLIQATVGETDITWACHAEIQGRQLVWKESAPNSSKWLDGRLWDVPEELWSQWRADPLARPSPLADDPVSYRQRQLLRRAQIAIRHSAFTKAAGLLEEAAQLRYDSAVEQLVDQLLGYPEVAEPIDTEIAEAVRALTVSLDQGQLDEAQQLLETQPANLLMAYQRSRSRAWDTLLLRVHRVREAMEIAQTALQEARAARQEGNLAQALEIVSTIASEYLPPELGRTLLMARRALLTELVGQTKDDPPAQQVYIGELEQVSRALSPQNLSPPTQPVDSRPDGHAGEATHPRVPAAASPTGSAEQPGWLDAALARNRERVHRQRHEQEPGG